MILKKFIAVVMALVIANPACCCAFKAQVQKASQASHSCCSEKSNSSHRDKEKPCSCSTAHEKTTPDTDFFKAECGSCQLLPQLTVSTETPLPKLSEAADFLAKWPPGRLPVASTQTRLAGKCSYLI
ncbi:MAG: hypothetical protein ABJQ29_03230 [Luteolibacter sp.]